MLNLPSNIAILFCTEAIDMRKSFDGLIGIVRQSLKADPISETLFVFMNKNHNLLKILYWDRDGFAIWYKRLEQGTFTVPKPDLETNAIEISRSQLTMILEGLEPLETRQRKRFFKKSE